MKKLNKKGFTLIELLAVIVIMGILMVVAIPAVSRTIENTRKDTFANTAKEYANQVKTLWAADGLSCSGVVSSAVANGTYYVKIDSASPWLMEQGGKSSWGDRDVKGYVEVKVSVVDGKTKTEYKVALSDDVHGITVTADPVRGSVKTDGTVKYTSVAAPAGSTECIER